MIEFQPCHEFKNASCISSYPSWGGGQAGETSDASGLQPPSLRTVLPPALTTSFDHRRTTMHDESTLMGSPPAPEEVGKGSKAQQRVRTR